MRLYTLAFIAIVFLTACSSTKKAPVKPSTTVTRKDLLLGGTSFNNAMVIVVKNEGDGIREEYKWLSNSYPGYGLIRRTQVSKPPRHYDIVRIKTRQGSLKDIYFDSTAFWGKP